VDAPTAPRATAAPSAPASHSLLGGLLGTTIHVTALTRTTPLPAPITVSKKIGILGGSFAIPQAGLTVVVPPLAVLRTTTFTATALAGSAVAYDFGPHMRFAAPLVATQSLIGTAAASGGLVNPLSLKVGYFPDSDDITSVTELLDVGIDLLNQTSIVTLWHFSGYMWASGRDGDSF
jgi:hypothetical protein